jgi:hypothetical protein
MGGQLRVAPRAVIGFDMTAALAIGAALGIDTRAVVELLPPIEAAMLRHIANLDEHSDIHQP